MWASFLCQSPDYSAKCIHHKDRLRTRATNDVLHKIYYWPSSFPIEYGIYSTIIHPVRRRMADPDSKRHCLLLFDYLYYRAHIVHFEVYHNSFLGHCQCTNSSLKTITRYANDRKLLHQNTGHVTTARGFNDEEHALKWIRNRRVCRPADSESTSFVQLSLTWHSVIEKLINLRSKKCYFTSFGLLKKL